MRLTAICGGARLFYGHHDYPVHMYPLLLWLVDRENPYLLNLGAGLGIETVYDPGDRCLFRHPFPHGRTLDHHDRLDYRANYLHGHCLYDLRALDSLLRRALDHVVDLFLVVAGLPLRLFPPRST